MSRNLQFLKYWSIWFICNSTKKKTIFLQCLLSISWQQNYLIYLWKEISLKFDIMFLETATFENVIGFSANDMLIGAKKWHPYNPMNIHRTHPVLICLAWSVLLGLYKVAYVTSRWGNKRVGAFSVYFVLNTWKLIRNWSVHVE